MSDITRAPLRPIGSKAGTITVNDANAYARDLVETALWGAGAYHPDGGYMDRDDRIRRLGEAVALLQELRNRASNTDGWNAIKTKMDEVKFLQNMLDERLRYNQFDAPYKNEPRIFSDERSANFRRTPVLPR